MPEPTRSGGMFLAFALTILAGFVDAAGYVTLDRVYASNMSGNSVSIALRLVEQEHLAARLGIVFAFVAGVVVSSIVTGAADAAGRAAVFALEAVLLVAFVLWADRPSVWTDTQRLWLAVIAGFAMGAQNASLTRIGKMSVFTTHVTGTLTKAGQSFGDWLLGVLRRRPSRGHELGESFLFGAMWVAFVAGAFGGAVAVKDLGPTSLVAPAVALALLALAELRHRGPIAER